MNLASMWMAVLADAGMALVVVPTGSDSRSNNYGRAAEARKGYLTVISSYSPLPRPTASAWAIWLFQFVEG